MSDFSFDDYQERAYRTAVYPGMHDLVGLLYVALGINGEAGEVAEKTKKLIRDKNGVVDQTYLDDITKELGDVLWYMSAMARELGISLSDVAYGNLDKLHSRERRNKIHGDGDDR